MKLTFGALWRSAAVAALVAAPLGLCTSAASAALVPTGLPGESTLVDATFSDPTSLGGLTLLAGATAGALPCSTAISPSCPGSSGVDATDSGALVLADAAAKGSDSSAVEVNQSFSSNDALYASFTTQAYGGTGGARTLWLADASASQHPLPPAASAGGYGGAAGGIPGAIVGVTLDATGQAGADDASACGSSAVPTSAARADEVVVRGGDTSYGLGSSGYCIASSTADPRGSDLEHPAPVGNLEQGSPTAADQQVVVEVLPGAAAGGLTKLEVWLGQGSTPREVLSVVLPQSVWPSDGSMPPTLRMGLSGAEDGAGSGVELLHSLHAVVVTPSQTPPSTPQNLGVSWQLTGATATATISWDAPLSAGTDDLTGFTATIGNQSCEPATLVGPYSCTIAGLPVSTPLTAVVTASSAAGTSTPAELSTGVGIELQTISFTPPSTLTFGQTPVALAATASSGLPVSFTATGPCTIVGSSISVTGVGACTIVANQSGSVVYAPAQVTAPLVTVGPGAATVTVTPVAQQATGEGIAPEVHTDPVGLATTLQYCIGAGASQVCSSTAPSAVGVYSVTASLNDPRYAAAPATATETIEPPAAMLPPGLGGPLPQGTGASHLDVGLLANHEGTLATITGHGFAPSASLDVVALAQQDLGTFTVPEGTDLSGLLHSLHSSTDAQILGAVGVQATSVAQLASPGSDPYPDGGYPGPGSYDLVTVELSGLVPGTTASLVLHSTPVVLAAGEVNADGTATVVAPIPAQDAGQQHTLYVGATNATASTSTTSSGSFTVPLQFTRAQVQSLGVGSSVAIEAGAPGGTAPDAAATVSANALQHPSPSTFATYDPLKHTKQTSELVTNVAAVVAAAGAAAGTAAAAAGAAHAGGAAGGHEHSAVEESIEVVNRHVDLDREHLGDRSPTWRTPGHAQIDDLSKTTPPKIALASPMLAAIAIDANYWRAMVGSGSLLLPLAGFGLGITAATQAHGYPLPPSFPLLVAIMAIGLLDAFAGVLAFVPVLVGSVISGRLFTVHMVSTALVVGTLFFGIAVICKKIRPFIREAPSSWSEWWVKGGDLLLGSAIGGYLAAKLLKIVPSTSHLAVPVASREAEIGWIMVGLVALRYVAEYLAVLTYPKRVATVSAGALPAQQMNWRVASTLFRAVIFATIFYSLLGRSWVVLLLLGIFAIDSLFTGKVLTGEIPTWYYRFIPRNLPKMLFFSVLGALAAAYFEVHISSPFWKIASLLILILSLNCILHLIGSAKGKAWPVNIWTRIAGVILAVLTLLQLTGNLIT